MDAQSEGVAIHEISRIASTSCNQREDADIEKSALSEDEENDMPPIPDTVPMSNTTAIAESDQIDGQHGNVDQSNSNLTANEPLKRRRTTEEIASFNMSDRKSKNCATFYFRHLDTDSEQNEDGAIAMEDSSDEEWTYTSSRLNITSEQQRNTNVVVRLDFREGQSESRETAEGDGKTSERKPVKESSSSMEVVDESNETDASSCNKKDSDDETSNDKTSIERLIKGAEKLVGEERRNGASKTFPQFIFDDKKGLTNNHRAKYARIKEWLKLNSARSHDGHSTSQ
ncbi:uncharacterized protein LOC122539032, partial [Frieseomelitta varia]|uniref:uncharacterized protein LOC122539032 n=1 Tax=Frieseomelitta varia TaxID=561572 RepID=UPI001CB6A24E